MAKHVLYLLMALLLAPGCAPKVDLPLTIYLDAGFDARQERIFLERMDEANRVFGRELMGIPAVFIYGGRYDDPDGFGLDDFDDGIHVIYKIDQPNEIYWDFLRDHDDLNLHSYAYTTASDSVFWMFNIINDQNLGHDFGHEPLHLLLLGHTQDPQSVMYGVHNQVVRYNITDKRLFCSLYDCVYPP